MSDFLRIDENVKRQRRAVWYVHVFYTSSFQSSKFNIQVFFYHHTIVLNWGKNPNTPKPSYIIKLVISTYWSIPKIAQIHKSLIINTQICRICAFVSGKFVVSWYRQPPIYHSSKIHKSQIHKSLKEFVPCAELFHGFFLTFNSPPVFVSQQLLAAVHQQHIHDLGKLEAIAAKIFKKPFLCWEWWWSEGRPLDASIIQER